MTDEERFTLETYEAVAEEFDATSPPLWLDPFSYHFVRMVDGGLILDVGCGTGRGAPIFLNEGLRYLGIDRSPGMLAIAHRKFRNKSTEKKVAFALMDMAALGFAPETFEGFAAIASLMHVPKLKIPAVLSGIRRVLKPGGAGFIATPMGDYEGVLEFQDMEKKCFLAEWQPDELSLVIEKAGFDIVAQNAFDSMFLCIVQKNATP